MDPILTIRFTPEKRDYVRASRVLSKKSTGFMIVAGMIVLAVIGSAFVLAQPGFGGNAIQRAAPIVFVVGLVYILYFLFAVPYQLGRAYRTKEHLRMERIMIFLDEHLQMEIGGQSLELPWEDLHRVIDGGNYYLMIFQGDRQLFPFIPGRAIADENTRQALLAFLKAKSIPMI